MISVLNTATTKRRLLLAALLLPMSFVGIMPAYARQDGAGFSHAQLKRVVPTQSHDACASFDAEFSAPLQGNPKATIDVDNADRIKGIISRALEVIQVTPKKYRLEMKADPATCSQILEKGRGVSVTVEDAKGSDGLPLLPDQRTFKVGRDIKAK